MRFAGVQFRVGAGLVLLAAAGSRGSVTGLTVADASTGDFTLTSLTISRGTAGSRTYLPGQLIGVDLTDVASVQLPLAVQSGASLPAPGTRAALLEDGRVDTGVINPFSTGAAPEDSFEVTFARPVVNSVGEDIIILEIGSGDPTRFWVNNDRAGHGLDVAASNFSAALLTGMPYTLYSYANGSDQNINDLAELESSTGFSFNKNDSGNVVGIGLDLSSLGIAAGASVTSLRFQTLSTSRIDPVLIVGLPAIPVAGDANQDGVIDPDDYVRIDRGYGLYAAGKIPAHRAGWSDGDFNGDGAVDGQDYLLIDSAWASAHPLSPALLAERSSQFGEGYVSQLMAAVPEPSAAIQVIGITGLVSGSLRRTSKGRRPRGN